VISKGRPIGAIRPLRKGTPGEDSPGRNDGERIPAIIPVPAISGKPAKRRNRFRHQAGAMYTAMVTKWASAAAMTKICQTS
jgi:hypothetical protein